MLLRHRRAAARACRRADGCRSSAACSARRPRRARRRASRWDRTAPRGAPATARRTPSARCRPTAAMTLRTCSSAIASVGRGLLGRQPPRPAMAARIEPERVPEARERTMTAVLDALEVLPHRRRSPRRIAGQVGDLIPVRVARADEDHRVVRGAAAERAGARIPDAVLVGDELRIALLLCRDRRSGGRRSPSASPGSRSRRDETRGRRSRRHRATADRRRPRARAPSSRLRRAAPRPCRRPRPSRRRRSRRRGRSARPARRGPAAPATISDLTKSRRFTAQNVFRNAISARLSASLKPGSSVK